MQIITSKDNELIKKIKKLKEKKFRDEENVYLVEGTKMLKEAIDEKANIHTIVVCEECIKDNTIEKELLYEIAKYECIYVTEKVFKSITDVTNPQGVLAVIEKKNNSNNINFDEDIIIILDGIQDPGNLGTILRTVDSIGVKQIIVSKDTVDSYNPKVVRSTMGASFRINVIETENLVETIKEIQKNGYEVIATSLETNNSIYDIDFMKKAIIIGNEANGISKEVQDVSDIKVKIPMLGKTESLNAGVAAGIMMYEYVRKKVSRINQETFFLNYIL